MRLRLYLLEPAAQMTAPRTVFSAFSPHNGPELVLDPRPRDVILAVFSFGPFTPQITELLRSVCCPAYIPRATLLRTSYLFRLPLPCLSTGIASSSDPIFTTRGDIKFMTRCVSLHLLQRW